MVLCYAGLGISFWPPIVPPDITICQAAAPPESQLFLPVGALLALSDTLGLPTAHGGLAGMTMFAAIHTVFFVLLALWEARLRAPMDRLGRSF